MVLSAANAGDFPNQASLHLRDFEAEKFVPVVLSECGNVYTRITWEWQSPVLIPTHTAKTRPLLTGDLAATALHYQRILADNPGDAKGLISMSLIAIASSQFKAAVTMARSATALFPHLISAWITLGQSLKASGQLAEAEHAYTQALRLDGASAFAHTGLGELKLLTGPTSEAILHFRIALRADPASISARVGLGNAFAAIVRYADALAEYDRALALRRNLPEAEFAAGFVLQAMNRPRDAEIRYRRALLRRPDFAAAWINLGCLLREQGRHLHAQAALQNAAELRPDLISAWINLALLAREQQRPAVAEVHLRKAFALNPGQVETHVAWCQFRAAEKDRAGAWRWLHWALNRDPDHAEAVNMHGILLHNEGRFADAVEAFQRAESLGNKPATSNRANSLLDLGLMTEALRTHELAVSRDPSHPGAVSTWLSPNCASEIFNADGRPTRHVGVFAKCIVIQDFSVSPDGVVSRSTAAVFFSTPSKVWATPFNSAVTPPWSLLAAVFPSCRYKPPSNACCIRFRSCVPDTLKSRCSPPSRRRMTSNARS